MSSATTDNLTTGADGPTSRLDSARLDKVVDEVLDGREWLTGLEALPAAALPDRDWLLSQIRARQYELEQQLNTELNDVGGRAIRMSASPRAGVYAAFVGLTCLATLACVLAMRFGWPWDWTSQKDSWPAPTFIGGFLLLVCVSMWLDARTTAASRRREYEDSQAHLTLKLSQAISLQLRTIANEWAGDHAEHGSLIITDRAPALVEIDWKRDPIHSSSYRRVIDFIYDHDTSAVGLAGARGAGKSTIMRGAIRDVAPNGTGISVSAPVYYEAPDMVRLIHLRLAESVLEAEGVHLPAAPRSPFRRAVQRLRTVTVKATWPVALAVALAVIALESGVYTSTRDLMSISLLMFLAAVAAAVCAIAIVRQILQGLLAAARPARSPVAQLALDALSDLGWSQTVQFANKGTATLGFLSTESSKQVEHAERVRAHPENVKRLRWFLERLHRTTGQRVLICVDELDKMADPEEAVRLVNGLKDLFHVQGVHFLVSVSTDALHRFAARGVPVRDVFDSSLDTVIGVGRMSFEETRALLGQRVLYFPDFAALFCHAWAGGHPRDVIRAARGLVERKRHYGPGPVPAVDLISDLIRSELLEKLDAIHHHIIKDLVSDPEAILQWLLDLRELLSQSEASPHVILRGASVELVREEVAGTQGSVGLLVRILPVYLGYVGEVSAEFAVPRATTVWRDAIASGELVSRAEVLAELRWNMGERPHDMDRPLTKEHTLRNL